MTTVSEPFRSSLAMLLGRARAGGAWMNCREKCGSKQGLYMTVPLYPLVTQEPRPDITVPTDPCGGIKKQYCPSVSSVSGPLLKPAPPLKPRLLSLSLQKQWIS